MAFDKDKFFRDENDRPRERVETPEWADVGLPAVYVRTMSGAERDSFEAALIGGDGGKRTTLDNYRAKMLVRCLADEAGNRLFDDDDAPFLGNKSAKVLDRLIDVARRLNGVSRADEEEMTKN